MYVGDVGTVSLRIVSDTWNDFTGPTINIAAVGDSITLTGGVLRSYLGR
jgi:hypothetical protein